MSAPSDPLRTPELSEILEGHRPLLAALTYRMLGSMAEAEDVVQDTFVRVLSRPPDMSLPLRPWLVRVACNLARDRLRHRQVRSRHTSWLPEPAAEVPSLHGADPEAALRLKQSATLAWLVAAEALTPEQRAVFLLRDVFDWHVDEVAVLLERSKGAVRSLHLRARRVLAGAAVPDVRGAAFSLHHAALHHLARAVEQGDRGAIEALLMPDATFVCDGAGEVHAVGRATRGAAAVASLLFALLEASGAPLEAHLLEVNGLPALFERYGGHPSPAWPTQSLIALDVRADGRIAHVFNVVAPSKLTRVTGAHAGRIRED